MIGGTAANALAEELKDLGAKKLKLLLLMRNVLANIPPQTRTRAGGLTKKLGDLGLNRYKRLGQEHVR